MSYLEKTLEQQNQTTQNEYFSRLRGLPLWIWDQEQHSAKYDKDKPFCCHVHALGLPQKNGTPKPLFSWQRDIIETLEQHKYLIWKKSRGLGATTLFLYWISYLCWSGRLRAGDEIAIVVGPNQQLATSQIEKLRSMYANARIPLPDSKQTTLFINGIEVSSYPSDHVDALRSKMRLRVIFLDELDYFAPGEASILLNVVIPYVAKSDPFIIGCSSPADPDGLLSSLEQDANAGKGIFKFIANDYLTGLGTIYSEDEINKIKGTDSFPREFLNQYIGLVGNCFRPEDIRYAVDVMGSKYNPDRFTLESPKSLGIDPAWSGSSKFALCVTEMTPKCINVLLAEEHGDRPSHEEMLERTLHIMQTYGINKVYVDSAASAFITSLKEKLGERTDWTEQIKQIRAKYKWAGAEYYYEELMTICPVVFSTEHKNLLSKAKMILESQGALAINPRFIELTAALTTATEREGSLLKDRMSHSDVFDALRLSLWYYKKIERRAKSKESVIAMSKT
jgi:hypothetical protein